VKKTVLSENDMRTLGQKLGEFLHGDETIELVGDVGAGKTTFVKGLAVGMGVDEDVQSPSFTISRIYDAHHDVTLAHYDFYRLGEAGILSEDVQESMADAKTVTVIEWAGIVDGTLPHDRIRITISPDTETSRIVEIVASPVIEAAL
jgi:tRNA threonylcarbamoyladenosine biosynthesis protein TsaE